MKIGRYEVVCKLGVGGMADVYLAHQPGPFSADKLVVIKQLRPGVIADDQFVQMFADESRIAVRLNHPNVVHTYEVAAEHDEYYLTLEFIDGKSLHQVLQHVTREEMPLPLHIWVITQVLTGLHYAHELKDFDGTPMGIVHRDVSPSNVILTYAGEVKLVDFGIAKAVGAIAATREGIIKGKLGYAAPEQCLCKPTDARTDVFAVGVMLWEAIAGRKRCLGETEASTYQARIHGTELSIEQACPVAPRELISICNRALARQPAERFPSALAFRQALDKYLRTIGWDAGTERLGEFMRGHFHEEIVEMRKRIDEHLGNSRALVARNSGRLPSTRGANLQRSRESANVMKAESLTDISLTPPAWFKRPLVLIAAAVGALCLFGLVLRFATETTVELEAPVASSRPSSSTSAESAPIDSRPTQPAGQISVALVATPSAAIMRLDGRRISNPYRAAHGLDAAPHHLTATLAGYQTVEQDILFERDVDIALALTASVLHRTPTRDRVPTRAPSSVPSPVSNTPAPKVATTAQPLTPLPGEDLRANTSRAKARDIDETDPYKR